MFEEPSGALNVAHMDSRTHRVIATPVVAFERIKFERVAFARVAFERVAFASVDCCACCV